MKCPYCKTPVDRHQVEECGDAWMGAFRPGWYVTPGWPNNYNYSLKGESPYDAEGSIPSFTTSLDAQIEHVWPVILKTAIVLDLEYLVKSPDWDAYIKSDTAGDYGVHGKAKTPALAMWRACIKYLGRNK